ncbi:hypothetical protein, partial [Planktothrix sp.]|uniref:hypothetical protein n=1 Tax=Planktothrix sp. TaxID=3088171 RepID=UPI0038D3FDC5
MTRPMFFVHRATVSLTLLLPMIVSNYWILPIAHSASSPPDKRDEQRTVTPDSEQKAQQPGQLSPST